MQNPVTAERNIRNLDIIGKTLVKYSISNEPISPEVANLIALLVAECRVYSAIRDNLTDEVSIDITNGVEQERASVSDAADAIIEDLRKDGINL